MKVSFPRPLKCKSVRSVLLQYQIVFFTAVDEHSFEWRKKGEKGLDRRLIFSLIKYLNYLNELNLIEKHWPSIKKTMNIALKC